LLAFLALSRIRAGNCAKYSLLLPLCAKYSQNEYLAQSAILATISRKNTANDSLHSIYIINNNAACRITRVRPGHEIFRFFYFPPEMPYDRSLRCHSERLAMRTGILSRSFDGKSKFNMCLLSAFLKICDNWRSSEKGAMNCVR
jgi:hypothetical protein